MSVGINKDTKIVVQGITGKEGSFHAKMCKEYGSQVVAGVTPGKGGQEVEGIPVYNTVREACLKHNSNLSLIFVGALFAKDAMLEAIDAGIKTVVCITEGIPVLDMMVVKKVAQSAGVVLIGPNTPGIISPNQCKAGIMPGHIFASGNIGMISRSGTLVYEASDQIIKSGLGLTTAVGIGGDPITGTDYIYWLEQFEKDNDTKAVVLIGEIGGTAEERAAVYIAENMSKPVFAFIAGRTAPKGKRMGHAGAIIMGNMGTVSSKDHAFEKAGVFVIKELSAIGDVIKQNLK